MTNWFTRWNIAAFLISLMIVSVAICIQSLLTDNKINSIVSGIIFVALSSFLSILQWLFPLNFAPRISKRERLFFISSLFLSILIAVVIIIEAVQGETKGSTTPTAALTPTVSSPSTLVTPVVSLTVPPGVSTPQQTLNTFCVYLQNKNASDLHAAYALLSTYRQKVLDWNSFYNGYKDRNSCKPGNVSSSNATTYTGIITYTRTTNSNEAKSIIFLVKEGSIWKVDDWQSYP